MDGNNYLLYTNTDCNGGYKKVTRMQLTIAVPKMMMVKANVALVLISKPINNNSFKIKKKL